MVVFTCNNCGETLQKPKVAKHYEFQCRTAPFVTCVDCFKDFRGEEYVAHTKCITEAERYGGKGYVPKAGANKGERKQQEWINVVNNILNSETDLPKAERSFLNILSKHENIPRKKAKFLNFVKSAMGNKTNPGVVESVWSKMETAYKNNTQNGNTQKENGKINEKIDDGKDVNAHQETNIIENQNNENIDRENQNDQQNKSNELNSTENGVGNDVVNKVKKKKSKKRMLAETVQEQAEEPVVKKKSKPVGEVTEKSVTKKKNKHAAAEESIPINESENTLVSEPSVNECNVGIEKSSFDWQDTVLDIVKNKGEISLKKLQKKVISRYMNSCSNTVSHEKASSKFNKKLKKISGIVVSDEKVRLA